MEDRLSSLEEDFLETCWEVILGVRGEQHPVFSSSVQDLEAFKKTLAHVDTSERETHFSRLDLEKADLLQTVNCHTTSAYIPGNPSTTINGYGISRLLFSETVFEIGKQVKNSEPLRMLGPELELVLRCSTTSENSPDLVQWCLTHGQKQGTR